MQFMIGLLDYVAENSDDNDGKNKGEYKDQQIRKVLNDVMLDGKVVFDVEVCIRFGQAEQRESFFRISAFGCGEGVYADISIVIIASIRNIHTVVDVRRDFAQESVGLFVYADDGEVLAVKIDLLTDHITVKAQLQSNLVTDDNRRNMILDMLFGDAGAADMNAVDLEIVLVNKHRLYLADLVENLRIQFRINGHILFVGFDRQFLISCKRNA